MQTGVRLWWDNPSGGDGGVYVRSDVAPYDYLVGACDNVSRVVQYVVVIGQGYSSNPLVDMRIHDITVVNDPNRRLPSVPEPMYADGTSEGLIDENNPSVPIPTIEDVLSYILQWWTGPWPELHTRLEQTTPEGPSIIYQEKCNLLGQSQVEMSSLYVSDADPIQEQPFYEALADSVIDVWATTLATKIACLISGVLASIACMFCVAPVNPRILIVAAGLVAAYTGFFAIDLALSVEKAISMTEDAIMRWWVIVASMSLVVLGWLCYGILIPYAGFYQAAILAATSTNFADWMCTLTEPSVIFLMWKICLIGLIFLVATTVFTMTILGLI